MAGAGPEAARSRLPGPLTAPALVLVHGAWHGPWAWDLLRAELSDVDVRAVALPSSGPDPRRLGDMAADAAAVRAAVAAVDGPVVVVGHSYGGVPITEALADTPGVTRLVYLAALMLDAGRSVASGMRSGWPDWWEVHTDEGYVDALRPARQLYGGVPAAVADQAVSKLAHQSLPSFTQPLTATAWRTVPATYIICENDLALAAAAQEKMATNAERVVRLPTAHSPFLSDPKTVARLLRVELGAAGD